MYRQGMSGIAAELDAKLKALDPKAASSLEKLVRDALDLVEAGSRGGHLPPDFFSRIAHEFGAEPFERPPQGVTEDRDNW